MIYFIGAGPGATDLITVRGMRLLQKADVVIYAGSLVNPELLDYCRPETTIYNSASMTLEQTVAAMRDAPEGATVVRLHTGDPCLYGAIAEQMRELDKLGLAYEVVPGVSSFCGAAAAIPADRLMLETDSPYLAPEPNRRKRNDSRNLVYIRDKIAALRGISPQELEEQTTRNALAFFGLQG